MKKLAFVVAVLSLATSLFAEGTEAAKPQQDVVVKKAATWPAFFAISEWPSTPQLYGVRLALPYSSLQENVCGVDLGLFARSYDFEGFAVNVLRNDVKDGLAGFQISLYNSAGHADMFALQIGLWNEIGEIRGIQIGAVNLVGQAQGLQVGLINVAETLNGYQIGVINVIRDAELTFFPVMNIGF